MADRPAAGKRREAEYASQHPFHGIGRRRLAVAAERCRQILCRKFFVN